MIRSIANFSLVLAVAVATGGAVARADMTATHGNSASPASSAQLDSHLTIAAHDFGPPWP